VADRLDLAAIQAAILKVKSLDLRTADIDQMRDMLGSINLGMLHKSPIIKASTDIRRGRIVPKRPRTIAEISYPPAKAVQQLGRLNRTGQSVFYGSVSMHAPVYEINPKQGDFVVISRWRNHRNLLVNNVGYSQSNLRRLNPARPLPGFANEPTEDPRDTSLNDFFADAFCYAVFGIAEAIPSSRLCRVGQRS
jgi:hypothetical protein